MLHKERGYASDMTGEQWEIIRPLLLPPREGPGRPPELDLRRVADAIFYGVGMRFRHRLRCGVRSVPTPSNRRLSSSGSPMRESPPPSRATRHPPPEAPAGSR